MFVIGTTSLSILGVGPALTRDLAVLPGAAGWLVTAFAATFALAAPLAQFTLGGRVPPRTLIVAGSVILAASLIWTALATTFSSLLMARVASALGGALIAPTSAALAIASVPDGRRGAMLAVVFAGFTLATVGGVPIATWLTIGLGSRGAMGAIGIGALAFLVLALIILPRGDRRGAASLPDNAGKVIRREPLVILTGTMGMLAAQFTIYALMGELLGRRFGVGEGGLPAAILLFGILGVAGNAAAGMLSDRVGAGRLVWISISGLAALLLVMLLDLGPYLGAFALAGCAFAGTLFATPQQSRLVGTVVRERHGPILALNSSASYLGIASGSALASALATGVGLHALPLAALAVLGIAAAVNTRTMTRSREQV